MDKKLLVLLYRTKFHKGIQFPTNPYHSVLLYYHSDIGNAKYNF